VEASLQHVMPFGWQREWVQGEQANQDDEGEYLYRRRDAKGESAIDSSLLQTHRGYAAPHSTDLSCILRT
jgi:hypothetical protein